MRPKRSNIGARVCALVSFVVLAATTLTTAPALALPEGRVYEMVTPPYKGGYPVKELLAVAPDGGRVAFASQGSFNGALSPGGAGVSTYLAARGGSGWSTTGQMPPVFGGTADFSTSLDYALGKTCVEPSAGVEQYACRNEQYLLHSTASPDTNEAWELAGTPLTTIDGQPNITLEEGASPDLCHVVVGYGETSGLLPEAEGALAPLYDLAAAPAGGCRDSGAPLRLVAVRNTLGPSNEPELINRVCRPALGWDLGSQSEPSNAFNAVAANGEEIFFETSVPGITACEARPQLFVRLGGERTLEVSRPLTESCDQSVPVPSPGGVSRAGVYFKGASEDGSRVFFTTSASLAADDQDSPEGSDLYMARIGCPESEPECPVAQRQVTSLVQVSHDPTAGQPAEVQGVVSVTPDGSHVYFVARGVLGGGSGVGVGQGGPVKGADNLYAYDSTSGSTAFIAELCSGAKISAEVNDPHCPTSEGAGESSDAELWGNAPRAQVNVCGGEAAGGCAGDRETGRFLVFDTHAQLVSNDTNRAVDVYRYDTQTGALERLSLGEGGYDANGNSAGGAKIALNEVSANAAFRLHELGVRAISEDGARIVFTTARRLSGAVSNGRENVYEWHEGEVSLISTGSAPADDREPVISSSGRDIYFVTAQGLVPQDGDGQYDIYDARVGGGFSAGPASSRPCEVDACQGPLTNPAPLLVPGSVSQVAGENLPVPVVAKAKPKAKRKAKPKKRRKASRRRGAKRARTYARPSGTKADRRGGGR
jgi:Tol biopolymer transport system component